VLVTKASSLIGPAACAADTSVPVGFTSEQFALKLPWKHDRFWFEDVVRQGSTLTVRYWIIAWAVQMSEEAHWGKVFVFINPDICSLDEAPKSLLVKHLL
jgi:hypothetical protein